MIQSIQKVIKIGSSKGVVLPAKELKQRGIEVGDDIEVQIKAVSKPDENHKQLLEEYAAFKRQYSETLKNLADR